MKRSITVDATNNGKRIDLVVGDAFQLSRSKVKALFEDERVRINHRKAKKGQMVMAGDALEIDLPEAVETVGATADAALELKVLHEDDALVFVDKAAHVPSQPLQPGEVGAVANALIARYPEMASVADDPLD